MSTPLEQWVESAARLTRPAQIVWCDGSEEEAARIEEQMVREGHTFPLNDKTYPNCFLHRSDPSDVARTEKVTFICTRDRGRSRTNQQLDGSRRSEANSGRIVRRLDEGPHDVRGSVHPGAGGLAAKPRRSRDHRQRLRRRQACASCPAWAKLRWTAWAIPRILFRDFIPWVI